MQCEVIRPFNGASGQRFQPGEIVDTTGWRWANDLIKTGHLRRVVVLTPPDRSSAAQTARQRPGGTNS